jgi:N-acetylmuramoyl-L-alanine amidase
VRFNSDGWLQETGPIQFRRKDAVCQGGALAHARVKFILAHWTGGPTLDGAVNWLTSPQAKASAHLVIGRDGALAQLVSLARRAWHAGESKWNAGDTAYVGLNNYSIGLEFVNLGRLRKTEAGVFVSSTGRVVGANDVIQSDDGKFYHAYSEQQIETGELLMLAIQEFFPDLIDVIGHNDVAPKRKIDPGPEFPFAYFRGKLFGRHDEDAPEDIA